MTSQTDKTRLWAIESLNEPGLFWSNEDGWVEHSFDVFDHAERDALNLPMGGKWVRT